MLFFTKKILSLCLLSIFLVLGGCATPGPHPRKMASLTKEQQNKIALAKLDIRLSMGYLREGDTRRAKEKLLLAQLHAPRYAPVWYAKGYYLESTGNIEEAKKAYLRSVKLAPWDGATENNYGTFLCRHGHYKASLKYFQQAVRNTRYLDAAGAYENMGLCALKIPDKTLAKSYFLKALGENGKLSTSLIEMMKLDYEKGHYQDAHTYAKRYATLLAPSPQSLWMQYRIAKKLGLKKEAGKVKVALKKSFPDSQQAGLIDQV